ncbi:MAG: hypothetical protein JWR33_809 [Naasia sp.]|nr:hypothetical protein [Naasia sp.]
MDSEPDTILSNGMRALVEEDRYRPGFLNLVVDGTPQSQVNPDDPRELGFEYVQRIGHVIDLVAEPGAPITAVHLGAGALTLPRYVAATRPGSRQQVLELEPALVDLVRRRIPLPQDSGIRVRYGDARAGLGKLPAALHGSVDMVVVDIFSGAQIPAHVTSVEFYREVAGLLAPGGVVAVNLADGPGLAFARGQAATLAAAVREVAALAETQILKGRRFGNIVLIGSTSALPLEWLPRLLAAGPHPAKAVAGAELRNFLGGAAVVTDESAKPSPPPARTFLAVDRTRP